MKKLILIKNINPIKFRPASENEFDEQRAIHNSIVILYVFITPNQVPPEIGWYETYGETIIAEVSPLGNKLYKDPVE